jgi:hypothetical protein
MHRKRRRLQEAGAHGWAGGQQGLDFLSQGWIGRTVSLQKGGALFRRQFQRFLQHTPNLLPAFRRHVSVALLIS